MDILSFIQQLGLLRTREDIFQLLLRSANDLGFEHVAYCGLTYDDSNRSPTLRAPVILVNYPPVWVNYYFDRKYEKIDPIFQNAFRRFKPFEWAQLDTLPKLTPHQQSMLAERRDAGLAFGLTVPIRGSPGELATISFASSKRVKLPEDIVLRLTVIACHFHLAYCALASTKHLGHTQLSAREAECLQWSASGKSSWEIGNILHISENTVNYHMKNAMRKLGTSSRVLAVLKAHKLRLIDISTIS